MNEKTLSIADYISIAAVVSGGISVVALLSSDIRISINFWIFSVVLDYLDGRFARKYGGSRYGPILDTLTDMVIFVIFPVMLLVQSSITPIKIFLSLAIIAFSVLRLSRYTVDGVVGMKGKKTHKGTTTLYHSFYIILLHFSSLLDNWVFVISIFIPVILMPTQIKTPKIENRLVVFIAVILIAFLNNVQ
ncbi:CDP-alcohol phosphatidyltransferase family protein [bacterium]|nr:CDP-alcohol phosphatidyltransferase family protein [bacterium]